MDCVTEGRDRSASSNNDGSFRIGNLTLGLGVNTNEIKVFPNLLHELVEVPLVLGRDGNVMRALINDVELFNTDLIDLVKDEDARHIDSVTLNDVNKLVDGVVTSEVNVSVGDSVLGADRLDRLIGHVSHCNTHALDDVDATLVLSLEDDVWGLLVEPDTETLELILDLASMGERLDHIENDEDARASSSDTDNLSTTTLTILGTFNNTGEIEQLNLGTLVAVYTGDASERCELVISSLGEITRQRGEQSGLTDGREADETDTSITRSLDVETVLTTATSLGAIHDLTLQLGKL